MKTYILQVDSPEYHKGDEARKTDPSVDMRDNTITYEIFRNGLHLGKKISASSVENNSCWLLKEGNEYAPFVPKKNEEYFFLGAAGRLEGTVNAEYRSDEAAISLGVFRTKDGAEMEKLRRESRAKAWMPEKDGTFYYYNFYTEKIERVSGETYREDEEQAIYFYAALSGATFKTEEEVQVWKEKYLETFQCLFK